MSNPSYATGLRNGTRRLVRDGLLEAAHVMDIEVGGHPFSSGRARTISIALLGGLPQQAEVFTRADQGVRGAIQSAFSAFTMDSFPFWRPIQPSYRSDGPHETLAPGAVAAAGAMATDVIADHGAAWSILYLIAFTEGPLVGSSVIVLLCGSDIGDRHEATDARDRIFDAIEEAR